MKIIHNEEIEQITFLDERFYKSPKTGNWYPSNTTYLDVYPKGFGFDQYLKDVGHNASEVLRRAGEQGTNIHNAIEEFLKGKELKWMGKEEKQNYTLQEWLMLLKFHDFYKTYKPKTIAVEIPLVSDKLEFGSKLDYVCSLPDFPEDIFYIDWKSGKGIYKRDKIQGSACKEIWNSQQSKKITRVGCLHLQAQTRGPDKSGKKIQGEGWRFDEVKDTDHEFNLFKHTQVLWKEENPNPKPKNMTYPDRIKI